VRKGDGVTERPRRSIAPELDHAGSAASEIVIGWVGSVTVDGRNLHGSVRVRPLPAAASERGGAARHRRRTKRRLASTIEGAIEELDTSSHPAVDGPDEIARLWLAGG
jgi:hypothetical protein